MANVADYEINLDFSGTQAAWHVLINTEIKGRSDSRNHNRAIKALKSGCMEKKNDLDWEFKGGKLVLNEDQYKYLKDLAKKKLDNGIPGSLAESYCSLFEAFEHVEDERGKKEGKEGQ